ncbi:MAG: PAS domain-containing protein [Neisseriaceae bacterium]
MNKLAEHADKNELITARMLTTKAEINDACALLYEIYIKYMQWEFDNDNPSNLHIEHKKRRNILVDRFTDKAVWFGTFSKNKLIGCARLCYVDEDNKFEVESYPSSKVVYQYLPQDRGDCVEMNRIALDTKYKNKILITHYLFKCVFEYCQQNHLSVIAFSDNYLINILFKRIDFRLIIESAFKYEIKDLAPVNFYFANYINGDITKIVNNIGLLKLPYYPNIHNFLDTLDLVAQILPTPVYWQDQNGKVLGANESCLKRMGTTSDKIIGHTPYYFYPMEIAEHILNHNDKIIRTGEVLAQEETANNFTTGELIHALAIKSPLYDEGGTIIGIIGVSIDITAQKEKERLERENLAHIVQANENQKSRNIIEQIVHEIEFTLSNLEDTSHKIQEVLPEHEKSDMQQIISNINCITTNILNKFDTSSDNYFNKHKNEQNI